MCERFYSLYFTNCWQYAILSITWWEENNLDKGCSPKIEIDCNGNWTNLITSNEDSNIQIFNFVYDYFIHHFSVQDVLKKELIKEDDFYGTN